MWVGLVMKGLRTKQSISDFNSFLCFSPNLSFDWALCNAFLHKVFYNKHFCNSLLPPSTLSWATMIQLVNGDFLYYFTYHWFFPASLVSLAAIFLFGSVLLVLILAFSAPPVQYYICHKTFWQLLIIVL